MEKRLKLASVPKRWPVEEEPLSRWRAMAAAAANPNLPPVSIALVGKYVKEGSSSEAYTSVSKALEHAAIAAGRKLNLRYVQAEELERRREAENPAAYYDAWKSLSTADGVLVPGGFGDRGWEGKLAACRMAREKRKPFLGVCLGMQCAAIEVARNVLGIEDAGSDELAAELGRTLAPSARIIVKMLEHDAETNNQAPSSPPPRPRKGKGRVGHLAGHGRDDASGLPQDRLSHPPLQAPQDLRRQGDGGGAAPAPL